MSKRSSEPEEAIGPAVDGLKWLDAPSIPPAELDAGPVGEAEPAEEEEVIEHPVALLCGGGPLVEAVASLAETCGFIVEMADLERESIFPLDSPWPIRWLPDFSDFVARVGIERNYFICIFLEDPLDCEAILLQCLESHAAYLGLYAAGQTARDIFASLRQDGVPDAELAAVRCPIGLNIGASTPEQMAVSVVAELIAVKNGAMNQLLAGNRPKQGAI